MRSSTALLVSFCLAIPVPSMAESPLSGTTEGSISAACNTLDTPASARRCMLTERVNAARLEGLRKGSASPAVLDATVSLRTREQMAAMADERERLVLGPVGSDGDGLAVLLPLLLLLALLGAGSSGNGDPVSPS